MTNTVQKAAPKAPEVNPLQQLQQQFSVLNNVHQAMVNTINTFPIDDFNKGLALYSIQSGFNHIEKYLNAYAQQMATPKVVGVEDAPTTSVTETATAADTDPSA